MFEKYEYTPAASGEDEPPFVLRNYSSPVFSSQKLVILGCSTLLSISLALNVFQYAHEAHIRAHVSPFGVTPFSGLPYDTPVNFQYHSDYWGENETLADELWEAVETDPVAIALTDDYAQAHNLNVSLRFPWDSNKGLYYIKVFHQMHCLKNIRRVLIDYQKGNPQIIDGHHILHCLDGLRQDLKCKADDTPMPSRILRHGIGDHQVHMCRNWEKLIAWTQAPERNACYRQLDDYQVVEHSLERHAFCPKDSPYYSVMTAYFNKFGHKDPFVA